MGVIKAYLFIDLDSARRFKKPPWRQADENMLSLKKRVQFAVELFTELQMKVAAAVVCLHPKDRVTITHSRLYHGWHRGLTPTDDRRVWEEAAGSLRVYTTSRASFLPDISFGNELICGGPRTPIFDTLRTQNGVDRQKLVDTALVADLLHYTRTESMNFRNGKKAESLGLVIADDDDLLPGVFVAEQWGLPVHVLRIKRPDENKHINLKNLILSL